MNARQEWRNAVCDSRLDPTAKLVALVLDRYMDGRGECWPSKAAIAAGSSHGRSVVVRAIHRLELAGFVLVIRSKGRLPNRYRATLPPNGVVGDTVNSVVGDTVTGSTVSWAASNGVVGDTRTRSTEQEKPARTRAEEPKPAAGAYHKFADQPPDIVVDEAMLAQARAWLTGP